MTSREEFNKWAIQQGYNNASKLRAGALSAWIARQQEINSLTGKLGGVSKHNKMLKEQVALLQEQVKNLRAERDAAIEAVEP